MIERLIQRLINIGHSYNMDKKILGVIGGLGPMATAYFLRLVTDMTDAETDQEHIETIIISRPATPDRTSYILGKSENSPLSELIRMEDDVCKMGAKVIAMPCITAHYFQKELDDNLGKYPGTCFIDGLYETAHYLKEHGIKSCGIMATDGTIESNLFQHTFEKEGIQSLVPSKELQNVVMDIIYEYVKKGLRPRKEDFDKVYSHLKEAGAEIILLGCTELSMIKRDLGVSSDVLDVLEVLARKSVMECGKLKESYKNI